MKSTTCEATMASAAVFGHVHTCGGNHRPNEDHFCPVCQRYWWEKGKRSEVDWQ